MKKHVKSTGIIKKIDSLGRTVIPKEIREAHDLNEDDSVEIFTEGDMIILKKYHPGCIFCKCNEDLTVFHDKPICNACLRELSDIAH